MHAHHGQEGQKSRGSQHRKHIAEVGGGRHLDVFDHIGIGLAALDDTLFQHHQVFFQQDDVCRFLGHIHRGIHRNADIRGLHGGQIIHAVSQKAHRVAVGLQGLQDLHLLPGRKFRKYRGALHPRRAFLFRQTIQLFPRQGLGRVEPQTPANRDCHIPVIPGDPR